MHSTLANQMWTNYYHTIDGLKSIKCDLYKIQATNMLPFQEQKLHKPDLGDATLILEVSLEKQSL